VRLDSLSLVYGTDKSFAAGTHGSSLRPTAISSTLSVFMSRHTTATTLATRLI